MTCANLKNLAEYHGLHAKVVRGLYSEGKLLLQQLIDMMTVDVNMEQQLTNHIRILESCPFTRG